MPLTINTQPTAGTQVIFTTGVNQLENQDVSINVLSDSIVALNDYVDGSLNAKVNRTLFDASILTLTNKDTAIDASLELRPLTTYVDGSLNAKANLIGPTNFTKAITFTDGSLYVDGFSYFELRAHFKSIWAWDGYYYYQGASGSFVDGNGRTISVVNGIITDLGI